MADFKQPSIYQDVPLTTSSGTTLREQRAKENCRLNAKGCIERGDLCFECDCLLAEDLAIASLQISKELELLNEIDKKFLHTDTNTGCFKPINPQQLYEFLDQKIKERE
jgi:hypothetical protein